MRVLIGGYYGFGNLGDEALLAGMVAALRRRGHRIAVLSADPPATARRHHVAAHHRLHGLPGALLRCEVFVSGGGGLLQDLTSSRSLDYYLGSIRLARRLRKRVVVFGQSIGPLSAAGTRKVARALDGIRVSVRDDPSQRLLADLGIEAHLGTDAALLLPCPDVTMARPGPVLLIPRHGHPWITGALAGTARRLAAGGVPCAALALHPPQDEPDVAALRRAAPEVVRLEADDPLTALGHVANARYTLSGRLHGLVLAAVCGGGHTGLVYDPKVAGFLNDSGAPGFGPPQGDNYPPADPARLADLASAAAPMGSTIRDTLRARAQAAADWLEQAMAS